MSIQDAAAVTTARLAEGQPLPDIARQIVTEFSLSALDLAVVLHESLVASHPPMMRMAVAAEASSVASDNTVADATYLAQLLVGAIPNVTPSDVAIALKDPRNYPNLTALQMGEVLKANGVFPQITAAQMTTALEAAGYSSTDTQQAVAQLFPAPPQTSYRRVGPVGPGGPIPFDDNAEATSGTALTAILVRHGEVVDAIQPTYGNTPTPLHGGNGGGASPIALSGNDPLVAVSGYTGGWYGSQAVLQITLRLRSGQTFGPFGTMGGSYSQAPFDFTAQSNEQIVGFFGSVTYGDNGQLQILGSLGVIIKTG